MERGVPVLVHTDKVVLVAISALAFVFDVMVIEPPCPTVIPGVAIFHLFSFQALGIFLPHTHW